MAYPLTQQGVADQLAALYALSNRDLATEAAAIKANFRSWVASHFMLTSAQQNYLNNMADDVVNYFGSECSLCFTYRLNITLEYPNPPSPSGYGKWTETTSSTKVSTNSSGGTGASGELKFKMVYIPL